MSKSYIILSLKIRNHIWFYKIEEQNNELLKLDEQIINKDFEITAKKKEVIIDEKKQSQEKIIEKCMYSYFLLGSFEIFNF